METEVVAVLAWKPLPANRPLVEGLTRVGVRAEMLTPDRAAHELGPGDVALVRLDVSPSLDGVEPGLGTAANLAVAGTRVLNRPGAVLAAHDKWLAFHRFSRARLPQPWTTWAPNAEAIRDLPRPFVLKPRFGSWGHDVLRCRDGTEVERALAMLDERSWFRSHGVLAQELIPYCGHDLRLLVAGGRVVAAVERHAAPGEWRTNESLGGHLQVLEPPSGARRLALRAARALGLDLVGVDLLPLPGGGYVVLEGNAAAEFDGNESLPGRDVYMDLAEALSLVARATPAASPPSAESRSAMPPI